MNNEKIILDNKIFCLVPIKPTKSIFCENCDFYNENEFNCKLPDGMYCYGYLGKDKIFVYKDFTKEIKLSKLNF